MKTSKGLGMRYTSYLASRFIAWNGVQDRYTRPNMDTKVTVIVRKPLIRVRDA